MKTKFDVPQAIILAAAIVFFAVVAFRTPDKLPEMVLPMVAALFNAFRGSVVAKSDDADQ